MSSHGFTIRSVNGATATGAGSTIDLSGFNVKDVAVQVTGITTGTVTIQGSIDGTTWVSIPYQPSGTGRYDGTGEANTFTADGMGFMYSLPRYIRANVTAHTTGTFNVDFHVRQ